MYLSPFCLKPFCQFWVQLQLPAQASWFTFSAHLKAHLPCCTSLHAPRIHLPQMPCRLHRMYISGSLPQVYSRGQNLIHLPSR